MNAADVIAHHRLQPHPEGGWFRETWRGAAQAGQVRGCGTSILFLLEPNQTSRWHRIDASELWLHQSGGPLVLQTALAGERGLVRLGSDYSQGESLQHLVRPQEWQTAQALDHWALVACVVVPAFQFESFELAPPGWSPEDEPVLP